MDLCLIAQSFSWFELSSWWAIAQVVIGLGFVIFVHELGHFLVAKACGVKCEKFYVGFDAFDLKFAGRVIIPRALCKWQWGETEYGIGIVPLGGYVKMLGQDDNPANFEAEQQRAAADHGATQNAAAAGASPSHREAVPDPLDRTQYDPRSYLAKSVPQRMAIISAGVIFNLIFAVLFATWAFRSGVNYTPSVIGTTMSGSPAWKANLDGATILRMGAKQFDEGYKTFIDMAQEAALHGDDSPLQIEYRLPGDNASEPTRTTDITPQTGLIPDAPFPMLGAERPLTNRLDPKNPVRPWSGASRAEPPLAGNDVIVAIEGQPVDGLLSMMRALAPRFDETVSVTVERTENGQVRSLSVRVPPNPMRELGFWCRWGAVTAIQDHSPAAEAGIQVGDRLLRLNGRDIGNLITLDQRIMRLMRDGDTEMTLTVARKQSEESPASEIDILFKPRLPTVNSQYTDLPFAINTMGVAVSATRVVEYVDPESQVGQQGLKSGDELVTLTVALTDEQRGKPGYQLSRQTLNLASEEILYPALFSNLQEVPQDLTFKLTVKGSDGQLRDVSFSAVPSEEFFLQQRGFQPTLLEQVYQAAGWQESLAGGFKQTVQETMRIVKILRQVVTGKLSMTNFGGPGTIMVVATGEGTAGTSRLLLFLTMLSANLAVINFLPIPVLDGGHMMFLAYEGIFRRPVTPQVQNALSYLGLAFILCLMLFVIFLDITRIGSWLF